MTESHQEHPRKVDEIIAKAKEQHGKLYAKGKEMVDKQTKIVEGLKAGAVVGSKFSIGRKTWRLYQEGPGEIHHRWKSSLFDLVDPAAYFSPIDGILAGPSRQAWKEEHYIWMTNCDTRKTSSHSWCEFLL